MHVEQQESDPRLRLTLEACPNEAEHAVREVSVSRPDLGAVQDIVIAIGIRPHTKTCEVRTGARFGIALAPVVLAREQTRQQRIFLRLRAIPHDARPNHSQPHGREVRRIGASALGTKDVALHLGPAGTAIGDGPARRHPALGMQDALPRQGINRIYENTGDAARRISELRRQLSREEFAHFIAEDEIGGIKIKIHANSRCRLLKRRGN
jgi:hypothetical protein